MNSGARHEPGRNGLLAGRRALVTGAANGIGRAVATEFTAAGATVVGLDVTGQGGTIRCDVCDEGAVGTAFAQAAQGGELTDVVHAAGTASVGAIRDLALEEWTRVLKVNLTGAFLVAREAARLLPSGGTLTLISSQAGLRGGKLWGAYSTSKFGVIGLMQCLAQELAPAKVRVNAVCPAWVETALTSALFEHLAQLTDQGSGELRAAYERGSPLGRLAQPEEVGRTCVFLASNLATFVTGTSLVVDGGELT